MLDKKELIKFFDSQRNLLMSRNDLIEDTIEDLKEESEKAKFLIQHYDDLYEAAILVGEKATVEELCEAVRSNVITIEDMFKTGKYQFGDNKPYNNASSFHVGDPLYVSPSSIINSEEVEKEIRSLKDDTKALERVSLVCSDDLVETSFQFAVSSGKDIYVRNLTHTQISLQLHDPESGKFLYYLIPLFNGFFNLSEVIPPTVVRFNVIQLEALNAQEKVIYAIKTDSDQSMKSSDLCDADKKLDQEISELGNTKTEELSILDDYVSDGNNLDTTNTDLLIAVKMAAQRYSKVTGSVDGWASIFMIGQELSHIKGDSMDQDLLTKMLSCSDNFESKNTEMSVWRTVRNEEN